MSHHAAVSHVDHLIETVHQHLGENSWLNILDMDNWSMGLTHDAEAAHNWANTSAASVRYWKCFDCGNAEDARQVLSYFQSIGLKSENIFPAAAGAQWIYAFKNSL